MRERFQLVSRCSGDVESGREMEEGESDGGKCQI
jgi:hypothetical protein